MTDRSGIKNPPLLALACSQDGLGVSEDLALLEQALQRVGIRSQRVDWTDPAVRWRRYAAILLRHTWDYHLKPRRFAAWLQSLVAMEVPVFNPVPAVLGNMHKGYLLKLRDRGIPIPWTTLLRRERPLRLPEGLSEHPEIIVKPTVSASSWRTFRLASEDTHAFRKAVRTIHGNSDALVQAFVPEIADGEWSLVYMGGRCAFAVLKRPAGEEFRVQQEFGGRYALEQPPPLVRGLADRVLAAHPATAPLAFARVDLVETAEGPVLMELELIEPDLLLRFHPPAAERLAGWLAACLRAH